MNRIIKYGLSIFVTISLICSVIFLPYIYYLNDDKKAAGSYVTESFSLDNGSESITGDEMAQLLSSDESLWVKSDEPIDNGTAINYIQSAVVDLNKSFQNNDYVLSAISVFYKDVVVMTPQTIEAVTVNGKVGEKAVSVSLLYAQYEKSPYEDIDDIMWNYSILIDRQTKKVYELYITTDTPFFDQDFFIEHDIYYTFIDDIYEQTITELKDYWSFESEDFSTAITDCEFSFNIMPMSIPYSEYSFNRFSSAVMGRGIEDTNEYS